MISPRETTKREKWDMVMTPENYNFAYCLALRYIKDLEDAEDIMQDVALKLWKGGIETFDTKRKPRTWLFTVTMNTVRDYFRKGNRNPESIQFSHFKTDEETQITFKDEDIKNPLEEASLSERADLVRQYVSELGPIHREVVESRYYSPNSYSDIAEALSIPIGTVKSRLYDAKIALEKKIVDSGKGLN